MYKFVNNAPKCRGEWETYRLNLQESTIGIKIDSDILYNS